MHRHSSGLCRKHLAATLRQWANRRADLLAPIVRVVKNVFTLVMDICSTVAPHDYATNNSTKHWDDLGTFTLAFLLPLCAANGLKLLNPERRRARASGSAVLDKRHEGARASAGLCLGRAQLYSIDCGPKHWPGGTGSATGSDRRGPSNLVVDLQG